MTKKQNCKKLLYTVFILFLLVLSVIGGWGILPAFADTSSNTSALTDLQKDSSFNISDYYDNPRDYSIQVIQVAESAGGELFLYTYQPCQKTTYLVATQLNMALTDKLGFEVNDEAELMNNDKPNLYDLTLVNVDGVFCKYKVADFIVSKEVVRYYNITSIYRAFNSNIDKPTSNDNIINSVYFAVGKLYKAETVDGSVNYSCMIVDTVEIKNPYVDFLSYYNGMTWASAFGLEPDKYTDVHYIAFSTDKKIDTLKEADVTYTTQSYKREAFSAGTTYGVISSPQYITLTGEMGGSTPDGFLAGKYTWKCIQRTSDFIEATGLNEDTYAYDNIKDTEFILVFLTTPYTEKEVYSFMQGHSKEITGTKVSNVSILRLMFETNGKTYNLGALMNQQEGDYIPGNAIKPIGFWAYIWRCIVRFFNGTATLVEQIVAIIALFFCLLFLPIILMVLSFVFPAFGVVMGVILDGIWTVIKWLLKGLWWLICLPFKGIKALINKIRGE